MSVEMLVGLKGIGETTAKKLIDNGITDLAGVAVMREDELASLLDWNRMKARETINDAKEQALSKAITLMSMTQHKKEITDKIIHYSTGSREVDDLIGGGIATNELTGLRGKYSTGKSQMCYTVAVNCIRDTGRKVAWIETEPGTFKEERVYQICDAVGLDRAKANEGLFVISAREIASPNHQFVTYERIKRAIKEGEDYGLIIIDSFSPKFREFYTRREMLPARSQETIRHIGCLQGLAANYNLAVLITVQIMGIPDAGKQLQAKKEEFADTAMFGGNVLKHSVQTWIALSFRSKSASLWEAKLFDSSYMPPGEAQFSITNAGVTDVQRTKGRG